MKSYLRLITLVTLLVGASTVAIADDTCPQTLDVTKRYLNSDDQVRLCKAFRRQVVLVVNTASKCGFTPQYAGLERIYRDYKDRGFAILGFPSNDFGGQEPGSEGEIAKFCRLTYSIGFPMFEKTDVAQHHAGTLYRRLATAAGAWPKWNFHKYLLDRDGRVVGSFPSRVGPDSAELRQAIEALL